jgi:hypothetical protein
MAKRMTSPSTRRIVRRFSLPQTRGASSRRDRSSLRSGRRTTGTDLRRRCCPDCASAVRRCGSTGTRSGGTSSGIPRVHRSATILAPPDARGRHSVRRDRDGLDSPCPTSRRDLSASRHGEVERDGRKSRAEERRVDGAAGAGRTIGAAPPLQRASNGSSPHHVAASAISRSDLASPLGGEHGGRLAVVAGALRVRLLALRLGPGRRALEGQQFAHRDPHDLPEVRQSLVARGGPRHQRVARVHEGLSAPRRLAPRTLASPTPQRAAGTCFAKRSEIEHRAGRKVRKGRRRRRRCLPRSTA